MNKRLGISIKLLIIYLIIAIPMVCIIAFSYVEKYGEQIEDTLQQRADFARMTARSFTLFTDQLSTSMKLTGSAIIDNQYPPEKTAAALGILLEDYPIDYAVLADATGTVTASTDKRLVGHNLAKSEAFKAIINGNELAGIEPVQNRGSEAGFHIAQAIRAKDGTILGIVASSIDVIKLADALDIEVPSGGVNIVDSSGHLVYQSEVPSLALTKPFWGKYEFVKPALSGQAATGTFIFPGSGKVRHVAEVPIEKFGWAAGSGVDAEDSIIPIRQEIVTTGLTTLAILLIALAISILIARRLIRSLEILVKKARAVGEGRFDEPIDLDTGDEIEDVARSLDETRLNLKRYVEGLSGIAETGGLLISSLELEHVKDTIARSASQLFGAKAASVFIHNETLDQLEPLLWAGLGAKEFSKTTFRPGEGISGRVFLTREPAIIQDLQSEQAVLFKEYIARYSLKSAVILPLVTGEEPFGVLGMFSQEACHWTANERELELLSIFASQVAIALENARLFKERLKAEYDLNTERERLAVTLGSIGDGVIATDMQGNIVLLNQVSENLTGWTFEEAQGKPLTEVFNIINEHTRQLAENPVEKSLRTGLIVGLANHTTLIAKDGTEISIADSCAPIRAKDGTVIGAVLVFRDITEEKRAEEALRESEERFRSLAQTASDAVVSIDNSGNIIFWNKAAGISFGYSADEVIGKSLTFVMPERFRKAHQTSLEQLIISEKPRIIGKVVELAGLKKDGSEFPLELSIASWKTGDRTFFTGILRNITERKQIERLNNALSDIGSAISSTLDSDEIMQTVAIESCGAIEAESAMVALYENRRWTIRYVHGLPRDIIGMQFTDEQSKAAAQAARTKQPVAGSDVDNNGFNCSFLKEYGVRSSMYVPLLLRENVIGILCFHHLSAPVAFTESKIDFAKRLATSVSLALENARLYAVERNIADTLQEALLTIPSKIDGLSFGYLYRSATEAAKVGGDFYDLFEVEPSKIGIIIGDVSGKGIEASALTSVIKNTIRAYASDGICSPASIISKTNNVLTKSSSLSSSFATVFFGILDIEAKRFAYCNAGHPPAMLRRKTSELHLLTTKSPLLGAFADLDYDEDEVVVEADDLLLLYTDGVIEARTDGELFGEQRLVSFIRNLELEHAKEAPQFVFNHIMDYTNGRLSDDVAIVAISPN